MSNELPRSVPIRVIDANAPESSNARLHEHEGQDGPRSLGQPAPCTLFVGETPISEAEIAREMQHHRSMKPEQSRADAARALVVRELLRRESERLGVPAEVTPMERETEEEAAIRAILENELEDRVPTEDDCRRYFEQNQERFRSPDRIRVRHVLLAAAPDDVGARLQARSTAEKLIGELADHPERLDEFAMRHSACPSKEQGGDLGWLTRGQTTPEFDRQVFRLREGLAGFPVESRWGYHVVRIDEMDGGQPLTFADVHDQIADYLALQVRQQEIQHYLMMLHERYRVRGLDDIVAAAA
ncbi:MAG: peptidylprolyl isomerase [Xanthomonadales bacterium]|nr:peptidylprolyl isomerase [Xanthomonadales bacterium]